MFLTAQYVSVAGEDDQPHILSLERKEKVIKMMTYLISQRTKTENFSLTTMPT